MEGHRSYAAAVTAALFLLGTAATDEQPGHCDPYLNVAGDHPFAYRLRGDRCEGIYIQELGSTPLTVASFVETSPGGGFQAGSALNLEWTAPEPGSVRLRALSFKPRLYYRMDTVRPAGDTVYRWPTDVLSALQVTGKDLGLACWMPVTLGGVERRVYLPLRISDQASDRRSTHELAVLPGVELREIFVTLAAVGTDGSARSMLLEGKPLGLGYYPANSKVTIPLGPLPTPGYYYAEIGTTLRGGGAGTLELWFFHGTPPEPKR